MSQVKIVPNAKTGSIISSYESNPEYGYVQLEQSTLQVGANQVRRVKRNTLLRGEVDVLTHFVNDTRGLVLPGKLVLKEYLESEVPDSIASQYLNKKVEKEVAISNFIKRAGTDGVELTLGGERILRFTVYDASGEDTDVLVAYDNVDAVNEQREALTTTIEASF